MCNIYITSLHYITTTILLVFMIQLVVQMWCSWLEYLKHYEV